MTSILKLFSKNAIIHGAIGVFLIGHILYRSI